MSRIMDILKIVNIRKRIIKRSAANTGIYPARLKKVATQRVYSLQPEQSTSALHLA